jgi:hypothetical protein
MKQKTEQQAEPISITFDSGEVEALLFCIDTTLKSGGLGAYNIATKLLLKIQMPKKEEEEIEDIIKE